MQPHKGFVAFLVILLFLSVLVISGFGDDTETVINQSTISGATLAPHQRKILYANGYWHTFYVSDEKLYHSSSKDGDSWGAAEYIIDECPSGYYASAWNNGSNFYLAHILAYTNNSLQYNYGSLESDGSLSWTATEESIGNGTNYATIVADSTGLPYVAYYNFTANALQVTKSSTANAWSKAASYPINLTASIVSRAPAIVSLTNQKMLAVYQNATGAFNSKYYNGTWQTAQSVSSTNGYNGIYYHSLVAIDDTAYFAFYSVSSTVEVLKWTAATGWSSIGTISGRTETFSLCVADANIYIFTRSTVADSANTELHWRRYTPSTNTWENEADFESITKAESITTLYEVNSMGETAILYTTTATSTPSTFYVKFKKLLAVDPPQTYEEEDPPSSGPPEGGAPTGPEPEPEPFTLPTLNNTQLTLPFVLPKLGTYGIYLGVGLVAVGGIMYAVQGSRSTRRRSRTVAYAHHSPQQPRRSSRYMPAQPKQKKRRYS